MNETSTETLGSAEVSDTSIVGMTVNGRPMIEHLEGLYEQHNSGEKIDGMAVLAYQSLDIIWQRAMKSGDFTGLDDHFFDCIAVADALMHLEPVRQYYERVYEKEPESILAPGQLFVDLEDAIAGLN